MEKTARATFWALDCRDVARVDVRMDKDGRVWVLEVNPLPGLTPDYSDLVLISNAVGMTYDQLIAEIMVGGLRRLRDKRREERELEKLEKLEKAAAEARGGEKVVADKVEKAKPRMVNTAKLSDGTPRAVRNGNGSDPLAVPKAGNGNGSGPAATAPADESQKVIQATVTSTTTH